MPSCSNRTYTHPKHESREDTERTEKAEILIPIRIKGESREGEERAEERAECPPVWYILKASAHL
jgi:hypothetical protein